MAVLLTYDVNSFHDEIKELLISPAYGYQKSIRGRMIISGLAIGAWSDAPLPNTTLYHATKMPQQAADDMYAVANSFSALLEKYIAFEVTDNWRGKEAE